MIGVNNTKDMGRYQGIKCVVVSDGLEELETLAI
jgi:hypothetical protein